ncbi:MAG: hypothetical protein ACWGQW_05120, partial [bacterium]
RSDPDENRSPYVIKLPFHWAPPSHFPSLNAWSKNHQHQLTTYPTAGTHRTTCGYIAHEASTPVR